MTMLGFLQRSRFFPAECRSPCSGEQRSSIQLDISALKRDQVGKAFPARVTRNVVVNGAVAIPASTPAEVVPIESPEKPGVIGLVGWPGAAIASF